MKLRHTLAVLFLGLLPLSGTTLLFDFGRTDLQTNPNWNNVVPATTSFAVVDSLGNPAGSVGFEVTDPLFVTGEPSQLGSEAPAGDAAGFPVSATDDYLFGHSTAFAGADPNPLGVFKLYNLLPGNSYSFTFFTSRQTVTDTRDTLYEILGATTDSVVLNASNNNTEVAQVLNIEPDVNDEIFIRVSAGPNNDNGNGFFYIGLMQVDVQRVPEPSVAGLLGAGLMLMLRRRNR